MSEPSPDAVTSRGDPALLAVIHAEIERAGGWISFAQFMELALYHPEHGYYLSPARRPGRGGDFLTAPEASPYFGLTLARQFAEFWERLDRPRRWVIREYGAGVGGLAYDILAGLSDEVPAALDGLQYRLIEPNQHRLAEALAAMREVGLDHIVVPEPVVSPGESLEPITGVALANEVADALPVHRLVARDGFLVEEGVALRDGVLVPLELPLSSEARAAAGALRRSGVEPLEHARYDVSPAAARWFAGVCMGIARGYVMVIDYGYPAPTLYSGHRLQGTVRGYYEHTVTDDPLIRAGQQDLTAHVDFTALQRAAESVGVTVAGLTTQGAMLASLGLGQRLLALQHEPDVAYTEYASAQAVVLRLIDPGGLGRFGVLIAARDASVDPPLLAFATPPPAF